MATTVTERFQENAAGATWRVGTSATRSFQVHFDTSQGAASAINAKAAVLSIFSVAIGVAHPNDSTIVCTDIRADCAESDMLTWRVLCSYSRPDYEAAPPARQPTLTKPVISFGSVTRQIVPVKAFGGALGANPASLTSPAAVPVKNSANYTLFGVPPIDQVNGLIRIGLYQATFDSSILSTHLNKLNNAALSGATAVAGVSIPKWQGRINTISADKIYEENGSSFHFIVNYEIEFMIETPMYTELVDDGLKDINGEIAPDGRPVQEPWPLNGSGVQLSAADKADPSKFKFWRYFFNMDANWATLGLPSTL